MQKRIKVLQIQPEYNAKSSGISELAEQIVKALPLDQYEVMSLYISGKPQAGESTDSDEHVEYLNIPGKDLKGLRLKPLFRLYQLCKKEQFDVIICHRFKVISLMLQLNKILHFSLCIGIAHSMDEYKRSYRRLQIQFLTNNRWRFVGVSETVRQKLISYNSGFTLKNTVTIQNAIDIDKVTTQQLEKKIARELLGLPQDAVIVGALGRLVSVKGHRYLISAFAQIKDQFPSARLAIIGDGKEAAVLHTLISDLKIRDQVDMLGWQDNAAQYVKAFDIWTLPSLQEGLPLALMEGMAGRLPVIASDIPQLQHIILGAGGIAVAPKDIDGLANALQIYLSMDTDTLKQKGEQAFQYLTKHHSIEKYHTEYRQLIDTVHA